ncbi:MAG TPA: STAS domain-containing protein [Solirubrobacterales bacterium]|nr:STAS domain-containing protein [Solirubrobacterales bacterium]
MSLSPHLRSPVEARPLSPAIRFECACKLDARGSASLELSGELDRAVSAEFESRLAEAQRASAGVTLDLRRLTFMDSAGYAVLDRAARASTPEATMILTGCSGQVSRLLNLVGLPEKVEISSTPDRSEAPIGA